MLQVLATIIFFMVFVMLFIALAMYIVKSIYDYFKKDRE